VLAAFIVATVLVSSSAGAARWLQPQTLPPAQPPAGQPPQPAQPAPPEVYTYDPAGRRDPFTSLLNRGTEIRPLGERPAGLTGLSVNEVALRGIVHSQGAYLAVLQAPDNKTYIVRTGDRLLDGSVRSISAETVVFLQEVNDPLSLVKEREIRRNLRATQEGR
jgi:Tfp pilus assembly protein PilP